MAEISVTEFKVLHTPMMEGPTLVKTHVTFSTATEHVCDPLTRYVRLSPIDNGVWFDFTGPGGTPDGSDAGAFLTEGGVEFIKVEAGGSKFSFYDGIS